MGLSAGRQDVSRHAKILLHKLTLGLLISVCTTGTVFRSWVFVCQECGLAFVYWILLYVYLYI